MIDLEWLASSPQNLQAALEKLQCGDHLCCLYESEEERLSALLAYILQGLQAGQKAICLADADTASHILAMLCAQGIAAHKHTACGQLVFLEKESVYLPKGYFDPQDMIDRLRAEEATALAQGYPGLRVAGEMSWALRGAPGSERLIEHEAKLNRFFPDSHCLALCQYDMRRFPPQLLLDILSTHPLAAVGSMVYENFYYIPPEEFLSPDHEATILRRQLKNLAGHSHEAQQLMRAVLDNTQTLMVYMDTRFNIIYVNRAFTQVSGKEAEQFHGKNLFDIFPSQPMRSVLEHAIASGQPRRGSFGDSLGWWDWCLVPIKTAEGRVEALLLTGENANERVRAEKALQEQKARLQLALYASQAGAWEWDIHSGHVFWDARCEELHGVPPGSFRGSNEEWRQQVHPDDLESVESLTRATLEKTGRCTVEYRVKDGQGGWRWNASNGLVLKDENGKAQRIIGNSFDITARKQAEEENARLLEQTHTRAEELNAMVQLSAALRQAQTFHEALPTLVEASLAALQASRGTLLLLEEEHLRLEHTCGEEAVCPQPLLDEHALLQVLRGGKTTVALCGSAQSRPADGQTPSDGDCILIPLRVRENPIGLLALQYETRRVFSPQQMQLADSIADMAGNTLQRMRLMARMERMVASRTRELGMLYEVISAASASFDIQQVLGRALAKIVETTSSTHGGFYMLDPQNQRLELYVHQNTPPGRVKQLGCLPLENSLEGWVVENDQPLLIHDMAFDQRVLPCEEYINQAHSYLGTPMHARGRVIGVMSIVRAMRPFNLDEISLLASIADHIGLIVENARLHQQVERAAVLEERSRLARDLHDSATQTLFSASLFADTCLALVKNGSREELQHYLEKLALASYQTLREMRLLLYQLRPSSLQQKGLCEALQERLDAVERRAGIEVKFFCNRRLRLNPQMQETLYWIFSEALNNATRHSAATRIDISVRKSRGFVMLQVKDNGYGFDPVSPKRGGMGLTSMRQRAEKAGGVIEISSVPRKGTTVTARLPLEAADNTPAAHGRWE